MAKFDRYVDMWQELAEQTACELRFTAPLGGSVTLYRGDLDLSATFRPEEIEDKAKLLREIALSFQEPPVNHEKLVA